MTLKVVSEKDVMKKPINIKKCLDKMFYMTEFKINRMARYNY